jgi:hypothetical protein
MVAMYDVDIHVESSSLGPVVQVAELESRLARGFEMIDEHREAGLSVTRLEEHWLKLLADYELLCDSQP